MTQSKKDYHEISELCKIDNNESIILLESCTIYQYQKIKDFVCFIRKDNAKWCIINEFIIKAKQNVDLYKYYITKINLINDIKWYKKINNNHYYPNDKRFIFNESKRQIIKSILFIFAHNFELLNFDKCINICNIFFTIVNKQNIIKKVKLICRLDESDIINLLLSITSKKLELLLYFLNKSLGFIFLKEMVLKIYEDPNILFNIINKNMYILDNTEQLKYIIIIIAEYYESNKIVGCDYNIMDNCIKSLCSNNIINDEIKDETVHDESNTSYGKDEKISDETNTSYTNDNSIDDLVIDDINFSNENEQCIKILHNTHLNLNNNTFLLHTNYTSIKYKYTIGCIYENDEKIGINFKGHVLIENDDINRPIIKGDIIIINNNVYQYWIFTNFLMYSAQLIIINNQLCQYIYIDHIDMFKHIDIGY